ncbi:MAG TPA: hypothetical protein VN521_09355 [Negativicutes bacterium]|nr:hypothetical protein [Negativicutes bacterium]
MPARIVAFPAERAQDEVDGRIRRYLAEVSTDAELVETVATRMKFFIDCFAAKTFRPVFDLAVPAGMSKEETRVLIRSIEKGVDAAAEKVEKMMCEIVIERLFLEVEIYKTRRTADSPAPVCPGAFRGGRRKK